MQQPVLGSNYFGLPFPLVLADRFFHIYADNGGFKIDVFRWDPEAKTATYEVRESRPLHDAIAINPTGVVTFTGSAGSFLFKFRPRPGVSQIFGEVPIDGEMSVRITDREMRVMRGDTTVATLKQNEFHGGVIGVQVSAGGTVLVGVNRLPKGMNPTTR
jgi:hypothetical protein